MLMHDSKRIRRLISAYRGDRFQRFRIEGDLGDTEEGSRETHRWDAGDRWTLTDSDLQLRSGMDAYLARE